MVWSDEGNALVSALWEARAALEAARQMVAGPRDGGAAGQVQLPPVSPSRPSLLGGAAELPTPSACSRAAPREGRPPQEMTALPSHFAHAAPGDGLSRGRGSEKQERRRQRSEAKAMAAQEAEEAAAATEALRRQCARRVASERGARREAQRREEEARRMANLRREADRSAAQQYASGAARRAEELRSHRQARAKEVMHDLEASQLERRQAGERKGQELQRRCQEADWGHCKSKLPPVASGARAGVGKSGSKGPSSCVSLPQVASKGPSSCASLPQVVQEGSQDATAKGSSLRLPRLVA